MAKRVFRATRSIAVWLLCLGLVWIGASEGSMSQALAREPSTPFALIMVDDPACRFCRKFDAEVGPGYPSTRQGRIAPLIKLRRDSYELGALGLAPAVYTPTFILMRGKREVGRMTGYPGAEYFFEELDTLIERAQPSR